jgi:hypothetical protein
MYWLGWGNFPSPRYASRLTADETLIFWGHAPTQSGSQGLGSDNTLWLTRLPTRQWYARTCFQMSLFQQLDNPSIRSSPQSPLDIILSSLHETTLMLSIVDAMIWCIWMSINTGCVDSSLDFNVKIWTRHRFGCYNIKIWKKRRRRYGSKCDLLVLYSHWYDTFVSVDLVSSQSSQSCSPINSWFLRLVLVGPTLNDCRLYVDGQLARIAASRSCISFWMVSFRYWFSLSRWQCVFILLNSDAVETGRIQRMI